MVFPGKPVKNGISGKVFLKRVGSLLNDFVRVRFAGMRRTLF